MIDSSDPFVAYLERIAIDIGKCLRRVDTSLECIERGERGISSSKWSEHAARVPFDLRSDEIEFSLNSWGPII